MQREHMVQDLEYLQGMYPGHMKRIQEYVMAACDRLDYKNSPMYDEFPDRIMVNQVCDSVSRQILEDGVVNGSELGLQNTPEQTGEETAETVEEVEEVEVYEVNSVNTQDADWRMQQVVSQNPPAWGPPPGQRPPQGPPPWGPPPRPQPQPPWGPPPWGPPPRPQPQPPRPPQNPGNNWLNDIVKILLLNEMHRRRCRSGICF